MNPFEWRATSGLAAVYVLRMLGLFMVLPVLAVHADRLGAQAGWVIGMAVGIYGLTQALLQVPFGLASDRLGRKPVILFGLLIFAAGSLLAAFATGPVQLILGRALQGAGAISAAASALLADLTRDERRTTAMAVLGISIGTAFILSIMLGPILAAAMRVEGLFLLAAAMALVAMPILLWWVPKPLALPVQRVRPRFSDVLSHRELLKLDFGIFALHASISALFVGLPLVLRDSFNLEPASHWHIYLPVMLLSVTALPVLLYLGERRGHMARVFPGCVLLLLAGLIALAAGINNSTLLFVGLLLYFIAFNFLEASLPALVTRIAPEQQRGAAMGVYSTAQFLGAFAGGLIGGLALDAWNAGGVFISAALLIAIWLFSLGVFGPLNRTAHAE